MVILPLSLWMVSVKDEKQNDENQASLEDYFGSEDEPESEVEANPSQLKEQNP